MKPILAIILIVLYANSITGLSPETRQKLEDAWNKDRKDVEKMYHFLKGALLPTKYDVKLEEEIANIKNTSCWEDVDPKGRMVSRLLMNDVAARAGHVFHVDYNARFFIEKTTKIGCSTTFKCHTTIQNDTYSPELNGKTAIWGGLCLFDTPLRLSTPMSHLVNNVRPAAFTYGKLIGVPSLEAENQLEELKIKEGTVVVGSSSDNQMADVGSSSENQIGVVGSSSERILTSGFLILLVFYI